VEDLQLDRFLMYLLGLRYYPIAPMPSMNLNYSSEWSSIWRKKLYYKLLCKSTRWKSIIDLCSCEFYGTCMEWRFNCRYEKSNLAVRKKKG
jgi:hypothetical protein